MVALNWGIVSAGRISHDFVNALNTLSDDDHCVMAIATESALERAQEFAKKHSIPNAYGNYDELANDAAVQVVYIGTLNTKHYEVAQKMLEAGKHILCEKPMCMNEKQTRKLITYAERKKLFLMEGLWSRFFPSYQYLRKQIDCNALGDIQLVTVDFGSRIERDRVLQKSLGGGTILDLGVYTIQLAQLVFQNEMPKTITATGQLNADGVDVETETILEYGSNGSKAVLKTSALTKWKNEAVITGTKGTIKLVNFWCPTSIVDIDGMEKTWPLPDGKYPFNFTNSCGLRYEAEEVRKCIRAGKWESDIASHNNSLIIAKIEDTIRKQIGVKYPEDDW